MKRASLLLRKDLRVLVRSPVLLGVLIAYPLLVAGLVGLVAGYGSAKPRVALVDEDNLPPTVVIGGHRFHVDRTIQEVSKNVKLVRLSPAEAWMAATANAAFAVREGSKVGRIQPGFQADLCLFDTDDHRHIPYHYSHDHVHAVVKRGRVVLDDGDRWSCF